MLLLSVRTLVVVILAYAAWRDVLTRTIPDVVSIALLALGVAIRAPLGWEAVVSSVGVSLALLLLLLPLIKIGMMGGADVKLLAAIASGLAPVQSIHLLLLVTAAGSVLAAVYLALRPLTRNQPRSAPQSWLERVRAVELWRIRRRAAVPYGVAIALGTAVLTISSSGA